MPRQGDQDKRRDRPRRDFGLLFTCLVSVGWGGRCCSRSCRRRHEIGITPFQVSTIFATSARCRFSARPGPAQRRRRPPAGDHHRPARLRAVDGAARWSSTAAGHLLPSLGVPVDDRVALHLHAARIGHRPATRAYIARPHHPDRAHRRHRAGQRRHGARRSHRAGCRRHRAVVGLLAPLTSRRLWPC